ncbi:MAG TPA: TetR/AcrR family transcriptional regulator [Holophagaceae bacterium]|nr:TetR/AcrR family transcriptional regulator [Holophagaceae bacterium]
MATHAARKQDTRERLLQAGIEVFTTLGLEAASARDIVKASGLAQGSFYNHFRTKEDVFDALVEPLVVEVRAAVAAAQREAATAEAFLREGFRAYLGVIAAHPGALPLIERNLGRFRAHIEGSPSFQGLVDDIRANVETRQREGMFRAFDAEWMAWSMVGTAVEVVLQADRRGRLELGAVTEFLVALFLPAVVAS